MARKIRLRIQLKLYKTVKNNDELVLSATKLMKTKIISTVQGVSRSEWTFGTARVWYNVDKDYWNEFRFENVNQLTERLSATLDPYLIRTFK